MEAIELVTPMSKKEWADTCQCIAPDRVKWPRNRDHLEDRCGPDGQSHAGQGHSAYLVRGHTATPRSQWRAMQATAETPDRVTEGLFPSLR
jgi:hypothetical protein